MEKITNLIDAMISYNGTDQRRIRHALLVHSYAGIIGRREDLNPAQQGTLEAAAVLHDIGIHKSEEKYHSAAGEYQQLEGPPIAREILSSLSFPEAFIDRVCFLISRHHTYTGIDGADYQILVEADFLVNIYEGEMSREAILKIHDRIFKTPAGKALLSSMFLPAL